MEARFLLSLLPMNETEEGDLMVDMSGENDELLTLFSHNRDFVQIIINDKRYALWRSDLQSVVDFEPK